MKVSILSHTQEPEKVIATAARLCYSKEKASDIFNKISLEEIDKMIELLKQLGHDSPVEHVSFTFAVEGVSRSLTHQLVRHRIASYSQQSQRYINFSGFDYYTPNIIENNEKANIIYKQIMKILEQGYTDISNILSDEMIEEENRELNKNEINAITKIAMESARMVLPNAATSNLVITMNIRSLWNFFNHRCCNRAQEEIQKLAFAMFIEVRKIAPSLFTSALPCAKLGYCKENDMQCSQLKGKVKTLNEIKI